MDEKIFKAALAGLLHDIGQFAQRGGREGSHVEIGRDVVEKEFAAFWPPGWDSEIADSIAAHHTPTVADELVKALQVADWLAAMESDQDKGPQAAGLPQQLQPIVGKITLDKGGAEPNWLLPATALTLTPLEDNDAEAADKPYPPLFPQQDLTPRVNNEETLWDDFLNAARALPGPIDSLTRFTGLMSVLRQYGAQIPAARGETDNTQDAAMLDVSLYDHLKITAAIAPCLLKLEAGEVDALHRLQQHKILSYDRVVARLVRADFGGIQSFIYRITTPEREREHRATAKRLRGRSFYLSLLAEVTADWLLRQLDLTAANALYIGGGRFDLLVPADEETLRRLAQLGDSLQAWLVEQFEGVISLEWVAEDLRPTDFQDLRPINQALDDKLAQAKQRKFGSVLAPDFFTVRAIERVCAVCGLTPTRRSNEPSEQICPSCEMQKHIGTHLPKSSYIARLYGPQGAQTLAQVKSLAEKTIHFSAPHPGPMDISVALLNEVDLRLLLEAAVKTEVEMIVYRLNHLGQSSQAWPGNVSLADLYLANAAPRQGEQVYDFDDMAELSQGAKLLGVLKADVDHLGLVFGLGLQPSSLSRVAALSHTFDRFFSGYLNTLCQQVTERWRQALPDEQKKGLRKKGISFETLTSLFYIVYAGGDDLLIIGPWDQTVELAHVLNDAFRDYTCRNPDITLSAGITLVKPHFPVQRFVALADEALEQAKTLGRDRITIFTGTTPWGQDQKQVGFEQLLKLAKALADKLMQRDMPRTLVHDILRLRQVQIKAPGGSKPMFTPQLLYLLTRRLSRKTRDELQKPILDAWPDIRIPASYVSLITRKE